MGYHEKIHLASDLCLNIAEVKLIKKLQKECKLFTGSGISTLENTIGKNNENSVFQTLKDKNATSKIQLLLSLDGIKQRRIKNMVTRRHLRSQINS